MPPVFLDARQLAERLGVTYGTIITWVHRGKLPFIRDGRRRYLFNLNSVADALKQQQDHASNGRPATAPPPGKPTKDQTAKGLDSKN